MYRTPNRLETRRKATAGKWILRTLVIITLVAGIAAAAAWHLAGKAAGPRITVMSPSHEMGQVAQLDVLIETPKSRLDRLNVTFEQSGKIAALFSLDEPGSALSVAGEDRLRLLLPVGKEALPELMSAPAVIAIDSSRPVLFGYRHARTSLRHVLEVRLRPPRISVLSTLHQIRPGGSEIVVYEVSDSAARSGVRVGEKEYAGFPASGAGIAHAGVGLRVAVFALAWDETAATPIHVFAQDDLGNAAEIGFGVKVLPRSFRNGRIELNEAFLTKVVPQILQRSPTLKVEDQSDLLAAFLRINGELRRQNGGEIANLARETSSDMLWKGAFRQLAGSAVEGGFADQRNYIFEGREVDRQVHLGYDLASTSLAEVVAANGGKVMHAGWLGIYGNCVILDHGMGLQSLYAHLSSVEAKLGSAVKMGDLLGRTGSTGLAGGDHLHFTMLVGGTPVTPLEWWSPKWVQDRVMRKLREAEALGTGQRGSDMPMH